MWAKLAQGSPPVGAPPQTRTGEPAAAAPASAGADGAGAVTAATRAPAPPAPLGVSLGAVSASGDAVAAAAAEAATAAPWVVLGMREFDFLAHNSKTRRDLKRQAIAEAVATARATAAPRPAPPTPPRQPAKPPSAPLPPLQQLSPPTSDDDDVRGDEGSAPTIKLGTGGGGDTTLKKLHSFDPFTPGGRKKSIEGRVVAQQIAGTAAAAAAGGGGRESGGGDGGSGGQSRRRRRGGGRQAQDKEKGGPNHRGGAPPGAAAQKGGSGSKAELDALVARLLPSGLNSAARRNWRRNLDGKARHLQSAVRGFQVRLRSSAKLRQIRGKLRAALARTQQHQQQQQQPSNQRARPTLSVTTARMSSPKTTATTTSPSSRINGTPRECSATDSDTSSDDGGSGGGEAYVPPHLREAHELQKKLEAEAKRASKKAGQQGQKSGRKGQKSGRLDSSEGDFATFQESAHRMARSGDSRGGGGGGGGGGGAAATDEDGWGEVVSKRKSPRSSSKAETLPAHSLTRRLSGEFAVQPPPSPTTAAADDDEFTEGPEGILSPASFAFLKVVGKGTFGKVLLVRRKCSGKIYAMKITSKKFLVRYNHVDYMRAERDIMIAIDHPFLVGLRCAFQTADKVYLVMPFLPGGELFTLLREEGLLLEDRARFYAAEMVLALEHLHALKVIHRDLKVSARRANAPLYTLHRRHYCCCCCCCCCCCGCGCGCGCGCLQWCCLLLPRILTPPFLLPSLVIPRW